MIQNVCFRCRAVLFNLQHLGFYYKAYLRFVFSCKGYPNHDRYTTVFSARNYLFPSCIVPVILYLVRNIQILFVAENGMGPCTITLNVLLWKLELWDCCISVREAFELPFDIDSADGNPLLIELEWPIVNSDDLLPPAKNNQCSKFGVKQLVFRFTNFRRSPSSSFLTIVFKTRCYKVIYDALALSCWLSTPHLRSKIRCFSTLLNCLARSHHSSVKESWKLFSTFYNFCSKKIRTIVLSNAIENWQFDIKQIFYLAVHFSKILSGCFLFLLGYVIFN